MRINKNLSMHGFSVPGGVVAHGSRVVFLGVSSLLCVSPVVFREFLMISQCFSAELFVASRPPIAGLSVAPWNKDDMGDGVPTDQLSHNHCDCTDSHCNSHIVTSCVFVLVLRSHHKSIGGRLRLLPRAVRDGLALCHLSRPRHSSRSSL